MAFNLLTEDAALNLELSFANRQLSFYVAQSQMLGNHLLRYSTFDPVHHFLLSLSPFPWHSSTALGIAAIALKEGQLGRIVVASL